MAEALKRAIDAEIDGYHFKSMAANSTSTRGPDTELSAVTIGAQLELDAIRFHQEQAGAATDEIVRACFLELANWERMHDEALAKQRDAPRAGDWERDRFSPS